MSSTAINSFMMSPTLVNMKSLVDLGNSNQSLNAEFSSSGQQLYYKMDHPRLFITQETQYDSIDNYLKGNKFMFQRLGSLSSALERLTSIVANAQQRLVLNMSTQAMPDRNFQSSMVDALNQVQQTLTTQFNGEYLFGGTSINTYPIDPTAITPVASNSDTPTANYYLGNSNPIVVRLDDNTSTTIGVTAGNSGVQKLLLGLRLSRDANNDPPDTQRMGIAMNWLRQAMDEITNDRAAVDQVSAQIETVNTDLQEFQQQLADSIKKVGYREQSSVLMELQQNRSALKMSQVIFFRSLEDISKMIEGAR